MAIVRNVSATATPEGYIEATWTGPYAAQIHQHDGTVIDATPGETTCVITAGEAKQSDHWRPVRQPAPEKTQKGDS